MAGDACQHIGYIIANAALFMGARIDKNPFKSETAGLETIERINQIIVFFRRNALFHHNVTRHRLDIAGDGGGDFNGERGIAYPYFNGAELRFWTNIPIKILHRFDYAGRGHFFEELFEIIPAQYEGRTAAQWEGKY